MLCANADMMGAGSAGFAELAVLRDTACYVVPDSVSDLQAGFVEPAAVGTRAARFSGVAAGDNVVFLGAEDYTLSAFQWVSRIAGQTLVADPSPARREMVASLGGATEIVDPNETDPVAWAADHMPWGADVVFVGTEFYVPRSHQYLSDAILIARPGGTVVISRQQGIEEPRAPLGNWVPPTAFTKELKILGFGTWFGTEPIYGGRLRGDYQRAIDGCATGQICGPGWKPTVVPFADMKTKADVDEVFNLYPDKAPKVLFQIAGK
jgi:threonine dehydrogenase-like Zn-dependent dehydrogenase